MKAKVHNTFKNDNSDVSLLSISRDNRTYYLVKNQNQITEFYYYKDALCEFYKQVCAEIGGLIHIVNYDQYIEIDSE